MVNLKVRAKNLGEWVEGYFCVYHGIPQILVDESSWETIDDIKTVGRYTGLCDKNGNKIFEGDIIRVDDTENAVVEYDETSAFYMAVFDRAESDFGSLIGQYPNVEVIGNIHDNPELLKGGEV